MHMASSGMVNARTRFLWVSNFAHSRAMRAAITPTQRATLRGPGSQRVTEAAGLGTVIVFDTSWYQIAPSNIGR